MSSHSALQNQGGTTARLLVLGGLLALACTPVLLRAQQASPEIKRAPASAVQAVDLRPKTTTSKSSGDSKDTTKKTARDAAADNQQAAPEGGPNASSKTGTKSVRATPSLGGRSQTTPEDALKAESSATSGRPKATLTPDNGKRPDFDQGFGEKRTQVPQGVVGGGNPMKSLTGGSVGGPLADSASQSSGVNGISIQGKGAISNEGVTSAGNSQFSNVNGVQLKPGAASAAAALEKSTGLSGKSVTNYMVTGGNADRQAMFKASEDDGTDPAPSPPPAKETPPSESPPRCISEDCKDFIYKEPIKDEDGKKTGERIVHKRSDGSKTTIDKDTATGETTITQQDPNGETTTEKYTGTPDEESLYKKAKDEYIRDKMEDRNFQIVQEAKAGSTVNPDRNDTGGGRVAGAVAPSQSAVGQNLFGNPGQRGGMGESGAGRTGIDFNGDAGAIDPGDGATVTTGNRQQDPGAFFDRGGGPTQGISGRPNTQDDEDKDEDEKKEQQTTGADTPR
jgi:hypothetical protein